MIQFHYLRLAHGTYNVLDLGYFLRSTDVNTYCDLGGQSLRDSHGSIDRPEDGIKDSNTIISLDSMLHDEQQNIPRLISSAQEAG